MKREVSIRQAFNGFIVTLCPLSPGEDSVVLVFPTLRKTLQAVALFFEGKLFQKEENGKAKSEEAVVGAVI